MRAKVLNLRRAHPGFRQRDQPPARTPARAAPRRGGHRSLPSPPIDATAAGAARAAPIERDTDLFPPCWTWTKPSVVTRAELHGARREMIRASCGDNFDENGPTQ
jgi:hypothetical protein